MFAHRVAYLDVAAHITLLVLEADAKVQLAW